MDTTTQSDDNIKCSIVEEEIEKLEETTPPLFEPNASMTIGQKIQYFVEKNKPKLYILTPCFGSVCYVNYVHSIINTIAFFKECNFPIQIEFCKNDSLVSRARNNLVARAMSDPLATHIMFIDNDITWNPFDIMRLILSEKELVGGIYPLKNYDWSKLIKDEQNPQNENVLQYLLQKKNDSSLKDIISDENMIQHNILRYNVNYLDNLLKIENNLAQIRHLATGFMMIKREVITKMSKAFPSTKYVDDINFLKPEENETPEEEENQTPGEESETPGEES